MEKRCNPRREPGAGEPLGRLRLRIGPDLDVLNISDSGALVESGVRLAPGSRLDVHVTTGRGRVLVRCRVIRSFAAVVRADSIRYRGGLAFDQVVDSTAAGYSLPAASQGDLAAAGNAYPAS
jgi:hypothetical protein